MPVDHITKDAASDAAAGKAGSIDWNKGHFTPVPWNIFSFHSRNTGRTWIAPPAAVFALPGDSMGGPGFFYTRFNVNHVSQVRFQMQVKVAGPAGLKIFPLITYYNAATLSYVQESLFNVTAEGELAANTTGYKDTGWKLVNATAKLFDPSPEYLFGTDDLHKPPMVAIYGSGGDSSTNVDIAMLLVQAK
jgi:hypothetical protein